MKNDKTATVLNDTNTNNDKELKFFLFQGGTICHPSILGISLPNQFKTGSGHIVQINEGDKFHTGLALDLKRFLMRTLKQEMQDTLETGIKLMEKHPEDYSRVFSASTPTYGDSNHEPTEPGILELLSRAYYELKSGGISRITVISDQQADEITMMSDIQRAGREKHWTDKPQSGLAHSRIFQYVYL